MDVVVYITACLGLSVLLAVWARRRGQSAAGVFFISLILSPLIGLIAVLGSKSDVKKVALAQGKKQCPECAEFVQAAAKVCRFCQHKFTALT